MIIHQVTREELERATRALRDRIYGPSTDKCWDGCKENWMRTESYTWLIHQVDRENKKEQQAAQIKT